MKIRAGVFRTVILFVAIVGLVIGCGRKTLPVHPQGLIPLAIEDLGFTQDESSITLTWTAPSRTTKGERLVNVDTFEVLRAKESTVSFCEDCPMTFTLLVKISGGATQKNGKSVRFQYQDVDLDPGHYYIYKIRSLNGRYVKSGDSNLVSLQWPAPLESRL